MGSTNDGAGKAVRNAILAILVIGAVVLFGLRRVFGAYSSSVPADMKGWRSTLASAFAEAKKTGKPVMADFNATWCGPCQMYREQIFNTKDFQARAKDFVLADIDVDKDPADAQKYGVEGIPDIRFFDSTGRQINQVVGFEGESLYAEMDAAKKQGSQRK